VCLSLCGVHNVSAVIKKKAEDFELTELRSGRNGKRLEDDSFQGTSEHIVITIDHHARTISRTFEKTLAVMASFLKWKKATRKDTSTRNAVRFSCLECKWRLQRSCCDSHQGKMTSWTNDIYKTKSVLITGNEINL
jgi:ribosomal protein L44E